MYDIIRMNCLKTKITKIKIGDSKDQVLKILGNPDCSWSKGGIGFLSPPKTPGIAYGKFMDWNNSIYSKFPYVYPFKLRLFGPRVDDIIVYLDDKNLVSRIEIPK